MMLARQMSSTVAVTVAMLIGCGLSALPARATYTVTLVQQGSNVVAAGSGTIDLTGLSLFGHGAPAAATIAPFSGEIFTGPATSEPVDLYSGFTGPTSFGPGVGADATSGMGDIVGVNGAFTYIAVPGGYDSGGPLSDTSTYDNQTFATLGLTPGSYTWTWGSGTDDSFTLDIGPAAAPEPSGFALLALPLGLIALAAGRRNGVGRCLREGCPAFPRLDK